MIAKNKVHKKILSYLKNKEFKKIYNNFDKFLNERNINTFAVSLSGGSDSMAMAYFSKCHQILNNSKAIIDCRGRFYNIEDTKIIQS